MLCFHCGKIGHREDTCLIHSIKEHEHAHLKNPNKNTPTISIPSHKPEYEEDFGTWMLVKKPPKKKNNKNPNSNGKHPSRSGHGGNNKGPIDQPTDLGHDSHGKAA